MDFSAAKPCGFIAEPKAKDLWNKKVLLEDAA